MISSRPSSSFGIERSSLSTVPASAFTRNRWVYEAIKPAVDLSFAFVMGLLALPFIVLGGLLVKLTSRGPIFYSQTRVGRFGRSFRIYKIRSMYHNCEATSGAQWATKKDPRVTLVGKILRKLHIDELPQIWNILRGDMSLVGPRPERPEFVKILEREIDDYQARHSVKPGLTGLAQIQLPPDSDIESVRKKLHLDLVYIHHRGFWLDLRVMFGTAVYLVGFSYAFVRKLLRLPHSKPVVSKPKPKSTARFESEDIHDRVNDVPESLSGTRFAVG
jgi:lipopolysaccharide/colanic/teichoic acid biosynthesis glycosyltransferase